MLLNNADWNINGKNVCINICSKYFIITSKTELKSRNYDIHFSLYITTYLFFTYRKAVMWKKLYVFKYIFLSRIHSVWYFWKILDILFYILMICMMLLYGKYNSKHIFDLPAIIYTFLIITEKDKISYAFIVWKKVTFEWKCLGAF